MEGLRGTSATASCGDPATQTLSPEHHGLFRRLLPEPAPSGQRPSQGELLPAPKHGVSPLETVIPAVPTGLYLPVCRCWGGKEGDSVSVPLLKKTPLGSQ